MSSHAGVVRGAYFQDLLAQPEALRRTIDGLGEDDRLGSWLAQGHARARRIVLTGMGSSLHALHPLQQRLAAHGNAPLLVDTSELVGPLAPVLDQAPLLVVVSQSGRSVEVQRLLDRAAGRVPLLAVTNDDAAPLASAAQATVLLRAGAEASVSCKTYTCTLAALEWLGARLCGEGGEAARQGLRDAVPAMQAYLERWPAHVAAWAELMSGVRHLFVTGRGPSLAAAGTGGLILKESARFPTEGMGSAAFRHGPFEMLDDHVFVAVYEGRRSEAALNRRLVADVRAAGGRAALIGPSATDPLFHLAEGSPVQLLLEILPLQILSLALAAREGREAGLFLRATKVTVVE